jgi:hypothetical protein
MDLLYLSCGIVYYVCNYAMYTRVRVTLHYTALALKAQGYRMYIAYTE